MKAKKIKRLKNQKTKYQIQKIVIFQPYPTTAIEELLLDAGPDDSRQLSVF